MKYFVYYSNSGNGDLVADVLKGYGYNIVKIETVKPLKKMNFFRILKYGGQAMMKKKTPIKPLDLNLKEDDVVVVGSPIWNDRLSTPINSFLDQYSLNKKTTRFVLYPAGQTTNKSRELLKKAGYELEAIVTPYPKKNKEATIKLLEVLK